MLKLSKIDRLGVPGDTGYVQRYLQGRVIVTDGLHIATVESDSQVGTSLCTELIESCLCNGRTDHCGVDGRTDHRGVAKGSTERIGLKCAPILF